MVFESSRLMHSQKQSLASAAGRMEGNEEDEPEPNSTAGAASSVQPAPSAAELKTTIAEMLRKMYIAKGGEVQVQLAQLVEQYNETARVPASKAAIEQASACTTKLSQ